MGNTQRMMLITDAKSPDPMASEDVNNFPNADGDYKMNILIASPQETILIIKKMIARMDCISDCFQRSVLSNKCNSTF